MEKVLIRKIFDKFIKYSKERSYMGDITAEKLEEEFDKFYKKYPATYNDLYRGFTDVRLICKKLFSDDYYKLIKPLLNNKDEIDNLIQNNTDFVKNLIEQVRTSIFFEETYSYSEKLRQLLMKYFRNGCFPLYIKDIDDFKMLANHIELDSNENIDDQAHKEIVLMNKIWNSGFCKEVFADYNVDKLPLDAVIDITIDSFQINKTYFNKYHNRYSIPYLAKIFHTILHDGISVSDEYRNTKTLKEWEELSDVDKDLIINILYGHPSFNGNKETSLVTPKFKKLKSLELLEYFTFIESSDSFWWKDKSVLSNVFATWYACNKKSIPKYIDKKLGKFKPLISLYGYDWNKIKEIIKKDQEVIEELV